MIVKKVTSTDKNNDYKYDGEELFSRDEDHPSRWYGIRVVETVSCDFSIWLTNKRRKGV